MRLPFSKPWRAFPEFDSFSDEECRRYARDATQFRPWLTLRLPPLIAIVLLLVWPGAIMLGATSGAVRSVIPLPNTAEGMVVLLAVSTPIVAILSALLIRDLGVYLGLRDQVNRARCPNCHQSLAGVPIQSIGAEPDPAKQFIRCPECGKKYVLMDIGLTPRDLVPFEQRGVAPDFGTKRHPSAWRRP